MATLDQDNLLTQWEETYKRGLLTFWMLLLLNQREMYAYEMGSAIAEFSQGSIAVDDNSVYRALRRFAETGIVASEVRESDSGPARRYFSLTGAGRDLLASFIRRNVLIFQSPPVAEAIQQVIGLEP